MEERLNMYVLRFAPKSPEGDFLKYHYLNNVTSPTLINGLPSLNFAINL